MKRIQSALFFYIILLSPYSVDATPIYRNIPYPSPVEKKILLGLFIAVFVAIAIHVIYITYLYRNKGRINKKKMEVSALRDIVWDHDKIIAYAIQIYLELQSLWETRNLTPLKDKLSASFYRYNTSLLNSYVRRRMVNSIENITILKSDVIYFDDYLDDNKDAVAILLTGTCKSYFTPEGSPKTAPIKEEFKDVLAFVRKGNTWILDEIINNPDFYKIAEPKTYIENK